MAVTKIKPVKARAALKNAVEYILDPSKTDGKLLVSSFGCSYETAYEEFSLTLSKAMEKGNNRAHHLIQSFSPGEATKEQAHEIGKRLADEATRGRFEYVLTTHIDKGHIHNHILFCAASFADHKKYVSNKKSYYEVRGISDRLCREYGLSVVAAGRDKGRSYAEYSADLGGGSWKSKLREAIDGIIPLSSDIGDFLKRLEAAGYDVKRGKYISVRAEGQERFTRTKTLGEDYTEGAIIKRIAGEYAPAPSRADFLKTEFTFDDQEGLGYGADVLSAVAGDGFLPVLHGYTRPAGVSLIVDIENSVKAQRSAGFARWQNIRNLQEAAKTLNFLTENNLLQYADLQSRASEVNAAFDGAGESLKDAGKRLADMARLIKHIGDYQRTKAVYDGLKAAADKGAYRRGHEGDVILHEAVVRALRKHAGAGGRLPDPARLRAEYGRLSEKKDALRAEYFELRRQAKELGVVVKNVNSILEPGTEVRSRDRGRDMEL